MPDTETARAADTCTPFASTPSPVATSLSGGNATVVTAPGVTANGAEKARPGMSIVPVVAVSPVIRTLLAAASRVAVNATQKSGPRLSWVGGTSRAGATA